jgi:RND family efflux transporter MFP subunit
MKRRPEWFLIVALALAALSATACKKHDAHEHAAEHPPGHDHHEPNHGHDDESVDRITRWSDQFELFAEYPHAEPGKTVVLLAHLTVLDDFRALDDGTVRLDLEGPALLSAEASAPVRPGIYELKFVPAKAGEYHGRLTVNGKVTGTIEGVEIHVHGSAKADQATHDHEHPKADEHEHEHARSDEHEHEHARGDEHEHEHAEGAYIEFLKEQQWGVPFGTAWARSGRLVESIEVAGMVTTPPGGSAEVGAPVAGRLVPPAAGLPKPGDAVRKGQLLATLAPAPSSPEASAHANLAVSEAEAGLARARAAAERSERLIRDQAISEREAEDARRDVGVAEEAVRAAQGARQLFTGATGGAGAGAWKLTAPIDGTLVEVAATPGASVGPGTVLFRIVDTRELWLRARVPEQDAARLRADRDASYQIAGLDGFLPIQITGEDATASVVTIGRTVDPTSRTVDLIYSLRAPDPRLRVGGLARMSVPAGDEFRGVVVTRSAVVDDDGREVVYVQVDGEHFVERGVRTGPRQGDLVGITHGLAADERVVTRGTQVVRLASRATSTEPHGHIH